MWVAACKPIDAQQTIALVERLAAGATANAGAASTTSSPNKNPSDLPAAAVFDLEF